MGENNSTPIHPPNEFGNPRKGISWKLKLQASEKIVVLLTTNNSIENKIQKK
jgi:hypothetical protein